MKDIQESLPLQIGKAGEHIVCADLLLKGYNAFLSDQGSSYDIVVESENSGLLRVQVKATLTKKTFKTSRDIYRFGLRRGNHTNNRIISANDSDILAFVALDSYLIAYIPTSGLITDGHLKTTIEFKDKNAPWEGREYANGNKRKAYGRFFQDHSSFNW